MKIVFYTNSISPHQLPLARSLVSVVGESEYRYIYTTRQTRERRNLGWTESNDSWIVQEDEDRVHCREWVEKCDVLVCSLRKMDLFLRRSKRGLRTFYTSERWFKPLVLFGGKITLDGRYRLLSPKFREYVRQLTAVLRSDPNFILLPTGIHAARDFSWMFHCHISGFEHSPLGRVYGQGDELHQMRIWGYFVAPSTAGICVNVNNGLKDGVRKVLWVGRMLDWKRVDVLLRAIRAVLINAPERDIKIRLTLVGDGPMRKKLVEMSNGLDVRFLESQPIGKIRAIMREHDLYVLPSNAYEGWGAVVNEALEEGLKVIGTWEAGSSATLLPECNLYHEKDWRRLAELLGGDVCSSGIGPWSASNAAKVLLEFVRHHD